MASKEIKVILRPGNEVALQSDAPDIANLISALVRLKDELNPDEIKIECDYEGFDKASFREVVIEATKDFLTAIRLERDAYDTALSSLEGQSAENHLAQ